MKLTPILIFIAIWLSPTLGAGDKPVKSGQNNTTLIVKVCYDYDSGIPAKLSFDAKSDRKKLWLGVSLYTKGFSDPLKEGEHFQIELNSDRNDKSVNVGQKFLGGSFEAALWGKKVPRADCTIPNCYWCARNGFHLDEMLLYKSGVFPATN
jgi:hypothetical protein